MENLHFDKEIGKILIFIGLLFIFIGSILFFKIKIPFLGRLPGDIIYKKKGLVVYFPLMSSIIISIILSLFLYFVSKFFK